MNYEDFLLMREQEKPPEEAHIVIMGAKDLTPENSEFEVFDKDEAVELIKEKLDYHRWGYNVSVARR